MKIDLWESLGTSLEEYLSIVIFNTVDMYDEDLIEVIVGDGV